MGLASIAATAPLLSQASPMSRGALCDEVSPRRTSAGVLEHLLTRGGGAPFDDGDSVGGALESRFQASRLRSRARGGICWWEDPPMLVRLRSAASRSSAVLLFLAPCATPTVVVGSAGNQGSTAPTARTAPTTLPAAGASGGAGGSGGNQGPIAPTATSLTSTTLNANDAGPSSVCNIPSGLNDTCSASPGYVVCYIPGSGFNACCVDSPTATSCAEFPWMGSDCAQMCGPNEYPVLCQDALRNGCHPPIGPTPLLQETLGCCPCQ
jgi:hypothetical protein